MRILIVDDEEFTRELIKLHLESLGITDVHFADNGRTGMQRFDSLSPKPDVVFSDIFMPEADGFEMVSGLQSRSFSGGVVLLSGVSEDMLSLAQDVAKGGSLDLWGTLVKPVTEQDVGLVLERLLAKE